MRISHHTAPSPPCSPLGPSSNAASPSLRPATNPPSPHVSHLLQSGSNYLSLLRACTSGLTPSLHSHHPLLLWTTPAALEFVCVGGQKDSCTGRASHGTTRSTVLESLQRLPVIRASRSVGRPRCSHAFAGLRDLLAASFPRDHALPHFHA